MSNLMLLSLILGLTLCLSTNCAWTYTQTSAQWATAGYPICTSGTFQSPINLVRTAYTFTSDDLSISTSYNKLSSQTIKNDGHAGIIYPETTAGFGTATYDNTKYTAQYVRFQQPSDHTFDSRKYDMEMHIFHQDLINTGNYLVIAVFFEIGAENSWLTKMKYQNVSPTVGGTVSITNKVDLNEILKTVNGDDYVKYYPGSISYPPCTQGVNYVLMKQVASMSSAQWSAFATAIGNNIVYSAGTGNIRGVQATSSYVTTYVQNGRLNVGDYLSKGEVAAIIICSIIAFIILVAIPTTIYFVCKKKNAVARAQRTSEAIKNEGYKTVGQQMNEEKHL